MARNVKNKPEKVKKALSASLLPTAPDEDEELLPQAGEAGLEAEEKKRFSWLKYAGPAGFGLLVFMIALVVFLPVNQLAWQALRTVQAQGVPIEVTSLDVGLLGGLTLKEPKISFGQDGVAKAGSLQADFSTLSILLSNRLHVSELEIKNLAITQGVISIARGSTTAMIDLVNIRQDMPNWRGRVRITARNVQADYNETLPIVNKKLNILINRLDLQGALNKRVLRLQATKNKILTSMGTITLEGSIILNKVPTVNVKASIVPAGELQKLIDEQREFFKAPGLGLSYLLDNPIEINITGPTNRIRFQPLKKTGGVPGNISPSPSQ